MVLAISYRCSQRTAVETAGPAAGRLIQEQLGAHTCTSRIPPDEKDQIARALRLYSHGHSIDLVLAMGGTAFVPEDVTLIAVLSRAVSGIRGTALILSLPGSERAAMENLQAILLALGHGLAKLRTDASDCHPVRRAEVG